MEKKFVQKHNKIRQVNIYYLNIFCKTEKYKKYAKTRNETL